MSKLNIIRVNPAKEGKGHRVVLDNLGRAIPHRVGGTNVPETSFYRRLIRDGDLVKIPAPPAKNKGEEKKAAGA